MVNKIYDKLQKYDLVFVLLILLISNFFLRWAYELHYSSLPYYFDQLHINYENTKWYTYMLPSMAKDWGGTWSSLGIGLLPLLKISFGNTGSYFILNTLFITVAFSLSWLVFRSKIITITVGICAAFTTLNDHVYQNSSLIAIYIPFIFCFFNMYSVYQLFQVSRPKTYWWFVWLLSLLLYILSFEGWVDYYAVTLLASLFCFYLLFRESDWIRINRLIKILSILTFMFLVFVILKVKYGYASAKGAEHDLIFNYGKHFIPLMIEDFIGNFFTFFYTTIITYIPPIFSFSTSLIKYGSPALMQLQNGYDPAYIYLTAINALLLWRFYAGVLITIFVYLFYQVNRILLRKFNQHYFFLSLFMLMVLFGSPAHFFVKFRPFHIIPWLAYQTFIGQIGIILLIAYALGMLHSNSKINKKMAWIITLVVWSCIISCAFLKPPFYNLGVSYGNLGFKVC